MASWRYRVRDLPAVWGEFSERLGIKCDMPLVSKRFNSKRQEYRRLTLEEVRGSLGDKVANFDDMRARYGFSDIEDMA